MEITVQNRDSATKNLRALRAQGLIPAVLYGKGLESSHLVVSARDFIKLFREAGTNTVITLKGGKKDAAVLVHDVQKDRVTGDITHIDFYQVTRGQKIKTKIPFEFLGEAPAVKEKGGVLNKAILELEVEAEPAHLPHRISVDLSGLTELDMTIYVKDLAVPKDVHVSVDAETTVVSVSAPQVDEEVTPATDVSAVQVESELKKAERDASKEE